ncbi:myosin-binding protein 3-like [Hibiscus syriacus]|uniref:myosin-binding protein 3-like n=1 Tax=Hibiscus syriacus TaxID=106335 RepID=UPI001922D19B|nr:myosin-binding protein 3-like [Hibiscus syriacus]
MDGNELAMAIKRSASNQDFNGSDKNTLRVLGQALDEEHATCAALYIELEKERSAAASAADEAMAMILRLQEEKAAIEMEAKQYRRTIEAKSAYDAEEMNILKEIMIRREREKYFLEKEVEACMQMFYRKEQLEAEADTYDITVMHERGTSSEEQGPLPVQQFNLQIAELDGAAGFLSSSIEKNEANIFRSDDENLNHQERHVDEKTINGTGVEEKRCGDADPDKQLTPKTTEPNIIFPCNNETWRRVEKIYMAQILVSIVVLSMFMSLVGHRT